MIFCYNINILAYMYIHVSYIYLMCMYFYASQIVLSFKSSPLRKEGWKTLL